MDFIFNSGRDIAWLLAREAAIASAIARLAAARDRWNRDQDQTAFDELGEAIDALAAINATEAADV